MCQRIGVEVFLIVYASTSWRFWRPLVPIYRRVLVLRFLGLMLVVTASRGLEKIRTSQGPGTRNSINLRDLLARTHARNLHNALALRT
jgi:hypothetical protein